MTPVVKKPRKPPKYKQATKVLDTGLQGQCSCGWKGLVFSQKSGLNAAVLAAAQETQSHSHLKENDVKEKT